MSAYPNLARRHKVAYVGTYPPKECGIATFTLDVVNSTDLSGWRSIVFAVDDTAPTELGTLLVGPRHRSWSVALTNQ